MCSSEAVQLNDREPLRCCKTSALPIATARVHPHIPRRRKSMSPWRASGGSTPPSTAPRKVSYWTTTLGDVSEPCAAFDFIPEFFLRRPLARSSSGVRSSRIPAEPTSPARALEWACQRRGVLNKLQYWALGLVRAAWPPLLRYEPNDPRFVETYLCFILLRP